MSNCPYLINNDKKIILIYSKKSGCTSLVRGFIENICGINDVKYNHEIINENKLKNNNKFNLSIDYHLIKKKKN